MGNHLQLNSPVMITQDEQDDPRLRQDDLLRQARAGDHEAYGALFMEYYLALIRYAWPMLRVREDAEDAVHDAFLKSWTRLDRLDCTKGRYSTWIFAITRNCCMDKLRYRKRNPASQMDLSMYEFIPVSDPAIDPESTFARRDRQAEVLSLVSALPATYRETIVLHYWNELGVSEIAEITRTSVSNVKSRLYRGRIQIAKLYEQRHPRGATPSAANLDQLLELPLVPG